MFGIGRALRGGEASPDELTLTRTFVFVWEVRTPVLLWTWTRQVRRTFLVGALPIYELISNQAVIDRTYESNDKRVTMAMLASIASRDPRALRLPEHEAALLWDAYCELNHFPKVSAPSDRGAETTPSESSSSASSSSAGPSTSPESASST